MEVRNEFKIKHGYKKEFEATVHHNDGEWLIQSSCKMTESEVKCCFALAKEIKAAEG